MSVKKGKGKNSVTLKMHERRVNFYENKGAPFPRRGQSGNVVENASSYEFKPGMLLKRKAESEFRTQESRERF
jgi:hypothetical protein